MDRIFKNNVFRIFELFIEHPAKDFSIRGVARELGLSHATVINYVDNLLTLALVKKKEESLYPTYHANTENKKYKFYKRNHIVFKIMSSGLIEFLQSNCLPSCIILFGSCAKATFSETSDIDIFIEAKKMSLNLSKYKTCLKRKINLLFEPKINSLSKELRNNIINGFVLYGFVKTK